MLEWNSPKKLIYIGEMKDYMADGFGKSFRHPKDEIFTGLWEKNLKIKGEISEVQEDGSRKRFQVEYDHKSDLEQ